VALQAPGADPREPPAERAADSEVVLTEGDGIWRWRGEMAAGMRLTPADRRGLTPLFWMHVLPYGEVNLDMNARLNLAQPATAALAVAG
jgi:hypothetical protein